METKNEKPSNFISAIVAEDVKKGTHGGRVVTRFPPEPSGYPHIGHAKSICLNFGIAEEFGGVCHLRMDDTNPAKESMEYVEALKRDIRWLGFEWGDKMFYASDYFEKLYEFAVYLIKKGKAYVCSLSEEDLRAYRGSLTEPGKVSPYAERSVEENLDLFARMRAGEFKEGEHILRARIDMASSNMKMRDPILYRIVYANHYRTGDAWCVYPMYDFAHCLSDSLEDITHSVCTLEFENNRELYDWLIEEVDVEAKPRQYEFARLSLEYTVMSKRFLLQLVEGGKVDGWDDPRMSTISGMRRRGYTPEAIRAFCEMIGVAKANSTVDFGKLEYCVRNDLNHKAPRVMAVLDPLKVVLTNYPEDKEENLEASYWPHDVPKEGTRLVPFTRELFIERSDFMENPSKKFRRLVPGGEVRLRYGYVIRCDEVIKNDAGEVIELRCSCDLETLNANPSDGRKIKSTIHWVSASKGFEADVRLYDRLFVTPRPGIGGRTFMEDLNPSSLTVKKAFVEPSLKSARAGDRFQFERQGYFIVDTGDSEEGKPVFNRTVTLRDSWASKKDARKAPEAKESPKAKAGGKAETRPDRKSRADFRAEARERNPDLAASYVRYQEELGLSVGDADVLTGDAGVAALFEDSLKTFDNVKAVTRFVVNEVLRLLKDRDVASLAFGGAEVGELAMFLHKKEITGAVAKEILTEIADKGGKPSAIIEERGLKQVSDADALEKAVAEVIAANPGPAERFKNGEKKLLGFLLGQVMKATGGKANPGVVRGLLSKMLA